MNDDPMLTVPDPGSNQGFPTSPADDTGIGEQCASLTSDGRGCDNGDVGHWQPPHHVSSASERDSPTNCLAA